MKKFLVGWFFVRCFLFDAPGLLADEGVNAFSSEKAAELDAFIERVREAYKIPGIAIGIVKDGKMIYGKGYGFRDFEKQLPVTADTIFGIGSNSKSFTAATVGILSDRGDLDIDLPISQNYLMDFRLKDHTATELVTTRDLLTHRTGLPRHDFVWYGSSLSRLEIYQRLRFLEPTASLREKWQYNNMMFMVAGILVEEISHKSWEDFTRENIFLPLGMKHSNLSLRELISSDDFAQPYNGFVGNIPQRIAARNLDAVAPAGAINSSVNDMSRWLILNIGKGIYNGERVISAEYLAEQHKPQMVMPPFYDAMFPEVSTTSYGLGWFISGFRGHKWVWHSGGIDGYLSHMGFFPEENFGVVILTNGSHKELGTRIGFFAYDLMLGRSPEDWDLRFERFAGGSPGTPAIEPDLPLTRPLQDYCGRFSNPGYGEVAVQCEGGDAISLQFNDWQLKLKHYRSGVFRVVDGVGFAKSYFKNLKAVYIVDEAGDIKGLTLKLEESLGGILFDKL